jgi:phage tail sheath protein FI
MTSSATTADDRGAALRRADRRSEGESQYVRVFDIGNATSLGLRPGPVATYEQRPGSTPRLVLLPLEGGNDMLAGVNDATYIGADHVSPEQRTGLFTLRNIEEVSIVAAPGRTNVTMQAALINHCELMRYRFAVLDGQAPPGDSIPDIQAQRQQFDTKYAALYHPWVLVADPFPVNGTVRQDYAIPPSGHMLGVYARTDIERGVHKAPANEVMRGVVGLQRVLNKEQHDILNPYPANINVIRDFRPNNRGIRVYGGRVITSDSDWKYVNVRRLLIFIEASIDRGLQWVVFEPNAEPLWARVRRAISNFLTLVWRNGALEGTKVEEAYFVKCDRTTMTQTDIDQGRLICLVGVAPVKPAEFVIVRIGLWTAHAED